MFAVERHVKCGVYKHIGEETRNNSVARETPPSNVLLKTINHCQWCPSPPPTPCVFF